MMMMITGSRALPGTLSGVLIIPELFNNLIGLCHDKNLLSLWRRRARTFRINFPGSGISAVVIINTFDGSWLESGRRAVCGPNRFEGAIFS